MRVGAIAALRTADHSPEFRWIDRLDSASATTVFHAPFRHDSRKSVARYENPVAIAAMPDLSAIEHALGEFAITTRTL